MIWTMAINLNGEKGLNRDQLIRFTELFENVHFEDPDIIVIRVEVAQLKKNVDNDANNPTLKKELYKKIKQYIDLVKEEFPLYDLVLNIVKRIIIKLFTLFL